MRNVVYGASVSLRFTLGPRWPARSVSARCSTVIELKETMPIGKLPRRPARTLAAVLLLVTAAPTAESQRAELERRIQRTVLPNGLEVIVVENRGVPLVTIEADVRNGSFTQPPDFSGLSHLYEHMFFKANMAYPSPDD